MSTVKRKPSAGEESGPARYLSFRDLQNKGIDFAGTHLRRMWKDGRFPKPIYLSPRKIVWDERTIDNWVASKTEAA
jgi:prophage regulatory protein